MPERSGVPSGRGQRYRPRDSKLLSPIYWQCRGVFVQALLTAYSLSGAAGIRMSWVMLVVACSVHFGYLHPAPSLAWVGSWWVILLASGASIVDFFGDKIPVLDHALHGVHVVLAPIVGAIAAMSAYQGDPVVGAILGVVGGGNALALHAAKSTLRAASSAATLGTANPFISILEDVAAVIFIVIAILAPVVTAVALVLATIWVFKRVRRLTSRRQNAASASA